MLSIWGRKSHFQVVRFLAEPVVEHQLDIVDDFAEEIPFLNFLQHDQRALFDGFAVQLEVNRANHLIFLQRCVQFAGA